MPGRLRSDVVEVRFQSYYKVYLLNKIGALVQKVNGQCPLLFDFIIRTRPFDWRPVTWNSGVFLCTQVNFGPNTLLGVGFVSQFQFLRQLGARATRRQLVDPRAEFGATPGAMLRV